MATTNRESNDEVAAEDEIRRRLADLGHCTVKLEDGRFCGRPGIGTEDGEPRCRQHDSSR